MKLHRFFRRARLRRDPPSKMSRARKVGTIVTILLAAASAKAWAVVAGKPGESLSVGERVAAVRAKAAELAAQDKSGTMQNTLAKPASDRLAQGDPNWKKWRND
jgi:hypothetical protein